MIEVFDAKRTRSYGCFASFKAATDTLDSLAATGQLGSVPAVSVAAYCSGVLQREYEAVFVGGKWRVPKSPKRRMPETRPARGRRRRKWCKEYATAELMFREGFPDHLNRSYPLSADSLRRCNRKCRILLCNNKNAMSMKTLADVKRKMTLGSKWRCVRLFEGGKDLGVREVGKVQGNAVAFLKPDGKLSWLWWPKAKDVQVEENAFTVLQNGVPKLKYIYAG